MEKFANSNVEFAKMWVFRKQEPADGHLWPEPLICHAWILVRDIRLLNRNGPVRQNQISKGRGLVSFLSFSSMNPNSYHIVVITG